MQVLSINESADILKIKLNDKSSWVFISDISGDEWQRHVLNSITPLKLNIESYFNVISNCDYDDVGEDDSSVSVRYGDDYEYELHVTQSCDRGETLFTETPLLIVIQDDIEKFHELVTPIVFGILSKIRSTKERELVADFFVAGLHNIAPIYNFNSIEEYARTEVISLCCPKESLPKCVLHAVEKVAHSLVSYSRFSNLSEVELAKLIVICSANAFAEADMSWVGLFRLGCRVNHSCSPNSVWSLNMSISPPILRFVALHDIKEGEEVTHSYLERERWYPTHMRRSVLQSAKYFTCSCTECTGAEYDFKRSLCCSSCRSAASFRPRVDNRTNIDTTFYHCMSCGHTPESTEAMSVLELEREWEDVVNSIVNCQRTTCDSSILLSRSFSDLQSMKLKAPLYWAMVEVADYTQSVIQCGSPEEYDDKTLYLKFLRVCGMHHSFPIPNNVEYWAITELLSVVERSTHKLKFTRLVEEMDTLCRLCGIQCPSAANLSSGCKGYSENMGYVLCLVLLQYLSSVYEQAIECRYINK